MIITGVMLVVCAIPAGVVFAFLKQQGVQPDLRWKIITGAAMTIAVGATGGLLLWIGETVVQRRWKPNEKADDRMTDSNHSL